MRGLTIGLGAVVIALFSADAMRAATDAAATFARGVLPALFPMMILNNLSSCAKTERFLPCLLFSFLSGTPASSQRVRAQAPSGARLAPMLAATGVMSPMFFVGTLASWTGDSCAAWLMLASHWLGALLTAALCGLARFDCAPRNAAKAPVSAPCEPLPFVQALPRALQASILPLLAVCASMMLFSILASVLRALLLLALPRWTAQNGGMLAVVHAALEIGGGCAAMLGQRLALPLVCAMCSFGGLSLWMQALLFVGDIASPARLLMIRAAHALASYGVCTALLRL